MDDRHTHALPPDTRLDCYRIESVLGSGAFGITYAAEDLELHRRVAVKEYFPAGLAQRAAEGSTIAPTSTASAELYTYGRAQFMQEARVLAQFAEPNIVRIHRYMEANDTAYLVMNYEDGHTLGRVLRRFGKLKERQLLAVAMHALRGLSALHGKGILHGDIKPANILVRRSGPPLLIDFGAARLAVGRKRGNMKSVMTPPFSALELFGQEGREGPWTDIYALGATLFQCASGQSPCLVTDRLDARQCGRVDPMAVALGGCSDRLSRELIDCIDWMLEPASNARPQSTGELLEHLVAIVRGDTGQERHGPATQVGPRPPPIQDPLLSAAQAALTEAVGPIAALLVERAATDSADGAMFLELLASKIPDAEGRGRFMAACNPFIAYANQPASLPH
ncbi:MAG: serine/threonine protein kinase [Gammaproteobacteria bacterium]